VTRTIGDDRPQIAGLAREIENRVRELLDRRFQPRADVVRLADPPLLEHQLDRAAVVVDV
jgi:hypothetical protein